MASVWLHERGAKQPRKVQGHLSEKSAIQLFARMVNNFKGFRRQVFDYEYLLFDSRADLKAHKPAGSIYIEFCSPPSAPEKGQPHYQAKGKA